MLIEGEVNKNSIMVLSNTHSPFWSARNYDKKTKIYKSYGAFMAVALDKGTFSLKLSTSHHHFLKRNNNMNKEQKECVISKNNTKNILIYTSNVYRCVSTIDVLKKKKFEVKLIITKNRNIEDEIKKIIKSSQYIKFLNYEKYEITSLEKIIKKNEIDLAIIAGFNSILSDNLIEAPKLGSINLHTELPNYLGGSVLNWQIINGEKKIGVTLLKTLKGIDNGPVIAEGFFLN